MINLNSPQEDIVTQTEFYEIGHKTTMFLFKSFEVICTYKNIYWNESFKWS